MIKLKLKTKRNLGLTSMSLIAACSGAKGSNNTQDPLANVKLKEDTPYERSVYLDANGKNKAEVLLNWDNNITTTIQTPDYDADAVFTFGSGDQGNIDVGFSHAVYGRLDLIVASPDLLINDVSGGIYIYWDIEQYKGVVNPNANYLSIEAGDNPYHVINVFPTDNSWTDFILTLRFPNNEGEDATDNTNMRILWDMDKNYNLGRNIEIDLKEYPARMLTIKYDYELNVDYIDRENEIIPSSWFSTNGVGYDFDGGGKNDILVKINPTASLIVFGEKQATGTFDLTAFLDNTATFVNPDNKDYDDFTIADQFVTADLGGVTGEEGRITSNSGGDGTIIDSETNFAFITTKGRNDYYTGEDRINNIDYQTISDAIELMG